MIKEFLSREKVECIGGFTAVYADPIMAHINPTEIHKKDLFIIIKNDYTIWATIVKPEGTEQQNHQWIEIHRDDLKRRVSPIMPRTYYFEIKKGDLFGTYVISDDIISNESFSDRKSYLSALIDINWHHTRC
ncbi:hypothetical protein [Neobacillus sp. DY30]|uniref:hypothetical protein n=1 Tax=Neobacillus sp. DY30 TaxID=3047871 RepID=UPI0024BFBE79|nr:hypothetical protein [Neobacillus sp. DY30]WHY03335.1 hypothetical protein QNH29_14400 [Neobacillus sp. DY30]